MKKLLLFLMIFAVMLPVLSAPALAVEVLDDTDAFFSVAPFLRFKGSTSELDRALPIFVNDITAVTEQEALNLSGIYFSIAQYRQNRYFFMADVVIAPEINIEQEQWANLLTPLYLYADYGLSTQQQSAFTKISDSPLAYKATVNGQEVTLKIEFVENYAVYHILYFDTSYSNDNSNIHISLNFFNNTSSNLNGDFQCYLVDDIVVVSYPSDATNNDIISSINGSSDDVVDAINKLAASSGASSGTLSSAIQSQTGTIVQSQTQGFTALQTDIKSLQSAVETFNDTMDEKFLDALEEYDKKESEKLSGELDGNVEDILNQLPLVDQQQNFTNATDALISALSDTSLDCSLTFPAGNFTLKGESYTLWEEQTLDFNIWFNNPDMQILLVSFRFVFAFGFIKYMIYWINKILKLILLEDNSEVSTS